MRGMTRLVAAALCVATPAMAQEFTAENGVVVAAHPAGFAVRGDAGIGARGYWCGAADYARQVRGARGRDRIYVAQTRPRGIGQRDPVIFTLEPSQGGGTATVLGASLGTVGANLSVGHAFTFCADHKLTREGGRS